MLVGRHDMCIHYQKFLNIYVYVYYVQQCCVIVFRRGRRIKNKYISSKPYYIYIK